MSFTGVTRPRVFAVLAVIVVGALLGWFVANHAFAETKWTYSKPPWCLLSKTSNARFVPDFSGYEAKGRSKTFYNSAGNCTIRMSVYYIYLQTRGWNSDLGWHIAEWNEKYGYNRSLRKTPYTFACGESACNRPWHITTYHYFKTTPSTSAKVLYTSHDGQHSSSCWWGAPPC